MTLISELLTPQRPVNENRFKIYKYLKAVSENAISKETKMDKVTHLMSRQAAEGTTAVLVQQSLGLPVNP